MSEIVKLSNNYRINTFDGIDNSRPMEETRSGPLFTLILCVTVAFYTKQVGRSDVQSSDMLFEGL